MSHLQTFLGLVFLTGLGIVLRLVPRNGIDWMSTAIHFLGQHLQFFVSLRSLTWDLSSFISLALSSCLTSLNFWTTRFISHISCFLELFFLSFDQDVNCPQIIISNISIFYAILFLFHYPWIGCPRNKNWIGFLMITFQLASYNLDILTNWYKNL